jgi:biotin synthase
MTDTGLKNAVLDILTSEGGAAESYFARAREVRRERFGDKVFLRAVVEFANDCRNDCLYCGMRRSNEAVERFQLADDEVLSLAREARDAGIPTFFLQSAEDASFPTPRLAAIVQRVTGELKMGVILCVGAKTREEFAALYAAGARKFIIKHETADEALFSRLKPGQRLEQRLALIHAARAAGFAVGSGTIVGLPGQTLDSLADDVLLLKKLDVAMASVSIFMPHAATPLAAAPRGDARLGARVVAAMRLVLPNALIPATSTFERALPGEGQLLALNAGANVITINMTPESRKNDYQLYSERYYVRLNHARDVIARAGLALAAEAM